MLRLLPGWNFQLPTWLHGTLKDNQLSGQLRKLHQSFLPLSPFQHHKLKTRLSLAQSMLKSEPVSLSRQFANANRVALDLARRKQSLASACRVRPLSIREAYLGAKGVGVITLCEGISLNPAYLSQDKLADILYGDLTVDSLFMQTYPKTDLLQPNEYVSASAPGGILRLDDLPKDAFISKYDGVLLYGKEDKPYEKRAGVDNYRYYQLTSGGADMWLHALDRHLDVDPKTAPLLDQHAIAYLKYIKREGGMNEVLQSPSKYFNAKAYAYFLQIYNPSLPDALSLTVYDLKYRIESPVPLYNYIEDVPYSPEDFLPACHEDQKKPDGFIFPDEFKATRWPTPEDMIDTTRPAANDPLFHNLSGRKGRTNPFKKKTDKDKTGKNNTDKNKTDKNKTDNTKSKDDHQPDDTNPKS